MELYIKPEWWAFSILVNTYYNCRQPSKVKYSVIRVKELPFTSEPGIVWKMDDQSELRSDFRCGNFSIIVDLFDVLVQTLIISIYWFSTKEIAINKQLI